MAGKAVFLCCISAWIWVPWRANFFQGHDRQPNAQAVDLGTSACKFLLVDETGKACNQVSREYPLSMPHTGWSDECDRPFWHAAAAASRQYLRKACHARTGLSAEYAEYDGRPHRGDQPDRHDWFFSDAYRTLGNIALDAQWFGDKDGWAQETAAHIQQFFEEKEHGQTNGIYLIDGTPVEGNALHPVGLLATIAQGSLILDDACADEWLRRFFSTPLRSGPRRYYDNCLYLFALLALSGHYRIWFPQEATV